MMIHKTEPGQCDVCHEETLTIQFPIQDTSICFACMRHFVDEGKSCRAEMVERHLRIVELEKKVKELQDGNA